MASKIKYFYLTDGFIGLSCLRDLIKENYIPELIITHKSLQDSKPSEEIIESLKELSVSRNIPLLIIEKLKEYKGKIKNFHLGICVGFMEILGEDIFNSPLLGIYNLHCGKLPEYRGRAPISRAIINGDSKITMTVHKIEGGVDSGAILLENDIYIEDEDDVNSVYKKCSDFAGNLIKNVFGLIELNNLLVYPENINKLLTPQKEYKNSAYKSITYKERIINWDKPAKEIYNLIRALTPPYPSAITYYKAEELIITKARIIENDSVNKISGYIEKVSNNSIIVRCSKGTIELKEILHNEKKMDNISEIFKTGDILK